MKNSYRACATKVKLQVASEPLWLKASVWLVMLANCAWHEFLQQEESIVHDQCNHTLCGMDQLVPCYA